MNPMISAILLSAGLSSRFGSPKALAKFNNKPIIYSQQLNLVNSLVGEIVVVLGAHKTNIQPHILNHTKLKFVYNKNYKFGQTSSFKTGLSEVSSLSQGVLVLPVDYPFVKRDTLNECIKHYQNSHPLILVPVYQGKKGHPPIFNMSLKEKFLKLDNDTGLNSVSKELSSETFFLPVKDKGVIQTFNTPEEFESIVTEISSTDDHRQE